MVEDGLFEGSPGDDDLREREGEPGLVWAVAVASREEFFRASLEELEGQNNPLKVMIAMIVIPIVKSPWRMAM